MVRASSHSFVVSSAAPRRGRFLAAWRPVLTLLILILVCGCSLQPVDPDVESETGTPDVPGARGTVSIAEGCDYTLPAWVRAEDYSGYVNHPERATPDGGVALKTLSLTWADLEPERGQYDWSRVDDALTRAAEGGYAVSLHVRSIVCGGGDPDRGIVVTSAVPDWAFEEFGLDDSDLLNLGWDFDIMVIPGWRSDIRAEFEALVRAFGEQGYPQRPELGAAYVHAISPSRGEEFWLQPHHVAEMEQRLDFGPDILRDWLVGRQDAYADAFGSAAYKLAWVGKVGAWAYVNETYEQVAWDLVQHAWDRGMGNRSSAIEFYHLWLNEPALGQSIDDQGYLHTDETIPPIAEGRYFGDENEEYGDAWTFRFGDRSGEPHRYRMALLRAMQMQLRFLWTGRDAETIDPALSRYAQASLGKSVTNSPDAWCYLKESPAVTFFTPAGVVRNFERWLVQRDVPGGVTVPTERVDLEFNSGAVRDIDTADQYDFVARRTDLASGNTFIAFDLDDRFPAAGLVAIKVEYRDAGHGVWRIQYVNASGRIVTTEAVTNADDGTVKTATFLIADADFSGGLADAMDFRIRCEGPDDLIARWVRLVRLDGDGDGVQKRGPAPDAEPRDP